MSFRNPNLRPIPANTPRYIRLKVYRGEFKGREQWKGRYRFYYNGNSSDYIDVVVNPFRLVRPSFDGEEWWIELTGMAPTARIVFAKVYERVREDNLDSPRGDSGAYYFRTHDERGKYVGETRKSRSTPASYRRSEWTRWGSLYEPEYDENDSSLQILIDEERENGEPPDRGDYD